jgi:hypothetical protein
MKRFIIKVFVFLMLPAIAYIVLNSFLDPYYGNPHYAKKYEYISENESKYNTIVFGSSLTYRQFIPKLFDSLMVDHSLSTFNMAIPAIRTPEIYYLYDKFLDEIDPGAFNYVILELKPLYLIDEVNINTQRNNYWLNLKFLIFAYKYIIDGDYMDETATGSI